VRPSPRREIAKQPVVRHGISIRLACQLFQVSQTCYRYQAKLNAENELDAAHRSQMLSKAFYVWLRSRQ